MTKEEKRLKQEEYRNRPEVKARNKIKRQEYYRRPEVKEKMREWRKQQRQKPHIKKRIKESLRRWRLKNPDYVKKYNKEYRLRPHAKRAENENQIMRYWQTRGLLNLVKVSMGCCDCGYNKHPAALEFDHMYAKKRRCVGQCGSVGQALKEAAKCVVRCSNCHRIKTFNERVRCGKKIRFEEAY
jgi:hypothetical protein